MNNLDLILESIKNKAEEEKNQILDQARSEAKEITDEAKKKASEEAKVIMEKAEKEDCGIDVQRTDQTCKRSAWNRSYDS